MENKTTLVENYIKAFGADIPLPEGTIEWHNNNAFVTKFPAASKVDEPIGNGLILGRMQKDAFIPSFPLIDHIAKFTKQTVTVDDKTAYLFTCGRDIFLDALEELPATRGKQIILNIHGDVLGVAIQDKTMLKNVMDRGLFLRQEMNKKKRR